MPQSLSRRDFLKTGSLALALATASGSSAIEPIKRPGGARMRLGLAAYSFRQYFRDGRAENAKPVAPDKQMDMFKFVDYCGEHDCIGAEVTSYYFPKNLTVEYLLKLKHHAFLRGVELSGTAVGNTFTVPAGEKRDKQIQSVKEWIDHAAVMAAPHIRVFAGNAEGQSADVARKNCIDALSECADYAAKKGIFLGIENHGGIVAEPDALLDIIKTVQNPWIGINLDSANFHTDDPYRDFERCVPYAINVQIKTEVSARGQKKQPADIKRFVEILRKGGYQGYVALEYEAQEDPYTGVPRALAELKRALQAA